uniref:U1-type domain-containing protein n=1 Tax=Oryzias sinensis TaxID=183150 RepID=A0A8C7X3Y1_9TELE
FSLNILSFSIPPLLFFLFTIHFLLPLSFFTLLTLSFLDIYLFLHSPSPLSTLQDCAETESHYQGKTHAKRVRLVLGEPPNLTTATANPTNTDSSPTTPLPTDPAACPPAPPALPWPTAVGSGNGGREAGKYCCLCGAWFNNPLMAQQHYEGKKHRRNAARARLLEQLAGSLDATESTGQHLEPVPRTLTNEGQRGC